MGFVVLRDPGARPECPGPARPQAGAAAPVAQDAIAARLPASLTGFTARAPQPTTPAWVAAGADLAPNGFLYGATQVHTRPDARVNLSVLQFSTVAGASAFDAADVDAVCADAQGSADVPDGLDASAMVIRSKGGAATRISMIRGSRLYLVVVRGTRVPKTLPAELATIVDRAAG